MIESYPPAPGPSQRRMTTISSSRYNGDQLHLTNGSVNASVERLSLPLSPLSDRLLKILKLAGR